MALEIAWTEIAGEDVAETLAYIAVDDDEAARRWHQGIVAAVERAAEFPRSGRMVPELGRDDVREVIAGSYRSCTVLALPDLSYGRSARADDCSIRTRLIWGSRSVDTAIPHQGQP